VSLGFFGRDGVRCILPQPVIRSAPTSTHTQPTLDPLNPPHHHPHPRRNLLVFDPLQKDSNGFSYNDIMIQPVTDAALVALDKAKGRGAKKTLLFGMQGEVRLPMLCCGTARYYEVAGGGACWSE